MVVAVKAKMGAANRGSLDVFMKRVCLEMNR